VGKKRLDISFLKEQLVHEKFRYDVVPVPRTLGIFVLLITFLAFTAGNIRNELALSLVGAVFLAVLAYCFLGSLLLSLLIRKKARFSSARILTKQVSVGKKGEVSFSLGAIQARAGKKQFLRLPGILIRYEMRLNTKDGRVIYHIFDPDYLPNGISAFTVTERGAYYADYDEFSIFDVPGFFRLSFRIPQEKIPLLLAMPKAAEETIPINIRSGGRVQHNEPHFLRTDQLIDHRPYTPGDDPRRINWKLYGHIGDLFVREGEPEPPPHSRVLILVDTQVDVALYTLEAGRQGVDLLCESALALAVEYIDRGLDLSIGYPGGDIQGGTQMELATALAYPAAMTLSSPENFPQFLEDRGILILALPRSSLETSALDRFLMKRSAHQTLDMFFLYKEDHLDKPAETCVSRYARKGGTHVRRIKLY
jgi:uncharacterized protein (DUF58 family)